MTSFIAKLEARVEAIDSLLCIGLDPHIEDLAPFITTSSSPSSSSSSNTEAPDHSDAAFRFCQTLIDATLPFAACYKPNVAFFEALGDAGMPTLKRTLALIPKDVPILLDAKRGDIGSTAAAYAEACYQHLGADAVTLSPLMGWDSVSPFVTGKYSDKGAFLLCKTSNPGSNEILALELASGETVFERIAHLAAQWSDDADADKNTGNRQRLGLVVGATDATALQKVRQRAGANVWILAPGIGAQGGDLTLAAQAGLNDAGTAMLFPVSRGVSRAADPSLAARQLRDAMNAERMKKREQAQLEATTRLIQPYQRDFVEFSLAQGVLKFGSFVLKSGRTSPYFFNAGLFASGAALYKLGKAYASAIMASSELSSNGKEVTFDIVFGPAYKGISLAAVVCASLFHDFGVDTGFAYNRKEAKDHGEGGTLVGSPLEGKRVLIVDDVITAGTAIRESMDLLAAVKVQAVVGVVIALDRAEKRSLEDPVSAVQAVTRDFHIPVVSIINLPQLQSYLESSPNVSEDTLASVSVYREQYGV